MCFCMGVVRSIPYEWFMHLNEMELTCLVNHNVSSVPTSNFTVFPAILVEFIVIHNRVIVVLFRVKVYLKISLRMENARSCYSPEFDENSQNAYKSAGAKPLNCSPYATGRRHVRAQNERILRKERLRCPGRKPGAVRNVFESFVLH